MKKNELTNVATMNHAEAAIVPMVQAINGQATQNAEKVISAAGRTVSFVKERKFLGVLCFVVTNVLYALFVAATTAGAIIGLGAKAGAHAIHISYLKGKKNRLAKKAAKLSVKADEIVVDVDTK